VKPGVKEAAAFLAAAGRIRSFVERLTMPDEQTSAVWNHREAVVNGVKLHYVEAGAGPLVVLLHGFPEFWYAWRRQIPALVAAGFQVLAPDLRGYHFSSRPRGVGSYRMEKLAGDVAGLIRHAGAQRATVVGHDWGGLLAWHLPHYEPEVADALVILNAPHPAAYRRELRTPGQLLRSWYVFFFQIPWLPERLLHADHCAFLDRALRHGPVHPGAFTDDDIARYREALARPGALKAAIHYYRALFQDRLLGRARFPRRIEAPTLLIWGDRDRFLVPRLTEGLEAWVPNLRVEHLPDASHWVQNDCPERVNRLLIDFLRQIGPARPAR
jgi:pimeloyl-ACP methyl ester carboxylesterase